MFTVSSVLFIAASVLGAPRDSYDFQQHKSQMDTIRFESAFLLWSDLDDSTRQRYYCETAGGGAAAANFFASFKAQKDSTISDSQRNISALQGDKDKITSDVKDKSYVTVDKVAASSSAAAGSTAGVGHGAAIGAAGGAASSSAAAITEKRFNEEEYNRQMKKEAGRLQTIDQNIQTHQNTIAEQQAKIASSSAYAANAVDAAENESAYIVNLETALQNGFKPSLRYNRLQRYESSQPRADETVSVVFDNPGRILVKSDGKFKVTATNSRSRKFTGTSNSQPAYKRFCIIDAEPGDTYSVRIQSDAAITATIEELR
jgi:hypothetical protein